MSGSFAVDRAAPSRVRHREKPTHKSLPEHCRRSTRPIWRDPEEKHFLVFLWLLRKCAPYAVICYSFSSCLVLLVGFCCLSSFVSVSEAPCWGSGITQWCKRAAIQNRLNFHINLHLRKLAWTQSMAANSWVSEPERATWMMSYRVDASAESENDISYISLSFWMMNFPFEIGKFSEGVLSDFPFHPMLCFLHFSSHTLSEWRTTRTSALCRRLDVFHAKLTFSSFHPPAAATGLGSHVFLAVVSPLSLSLDTPWTRIDLLPLWSCSLWFRINIDLLLPTQQSSRPCVLCEQQLLLQCYFCDTVKLSLIVREVRRKKWKVDSRPLLCFFSLEEVVMWWHNTSQAKLANERKKHAKRNESMLMRYQMFCDISTNKQRNGGYFCWTLESAARFQMGKFFSLSTLSRGLFILPSLIQIIISLWSIHFDEDISGSDRIVEWSGEELFFLVVSLTSGPLSWRQYRVLGRPKDSTRRCGER